ncbi:MAG TPA: hypothetical protein PK953_08265, partial [Smithellaceae bacterium]|nr:hypothetical protein [Syntrophaceae bacterium]HNY97427.1 hypothetical protein [Smithellaceae bacterium]HPB15518.1 hypothetical protein [Smithellaceae bacterium]HPV72719.1 hypothetical protein [Smithellaceae bacterium]HPY07753.1 hypothetical protein [Smithellaceae bacterium]
PLIRHPKNFVAILAGIGYDTSRRWLNEQPRRKQRGIKSFLFCMGHSPQAAGNGTLRDSTKERRQR